MIETKTTEFFTDKYTDIMKLETNILMVTESGEIEDNSFGK